MGVKDIAVQLGQLSVIRARHDNIWVTHCQTGQQVAAVTRGVTQQCEVVLGNIIIGIA